MRLKVLFCVAVLLLTISVAPYLNDRAEAVIFSKDVTGSSFLNGWYKPVSVDSKVWVKKPIQTPAPAPAPAKPQIPAPAQPRNNIGNVQVLAEDETKMLEMVNNARSAEGLKAVSLDNRLRTLARLKALEMVRKGYFGHTSPTYGTLTAMLQNNSIKYELAAENLAGAPGVKEAFAGLMGSPAHKNNILNPQFTSIGIGAAGPSLKYGKVFVQILIKKPATSPVVNPPVETPPVVNPPVSNPPVETPPVVNPPVNNPPVETPPVVNPPVNNPPVNNPPVETPPVVNPPVNNPPVETPPVVNPPAEPAPIQGLTADEQKMFDLVNQERVKAGLNPFVIDLEIVKVARLKAQDMIDKNYFDHNSPTYGSPFEMMKKFGIVYKMAGENLAGAPSVDLAHTNLMNSTGHRANILRTQFTHVGIGIIDGGPYGKMFVQMFIQK